MANHERERENFYRPRGQMVVIRGRLIGSFSKAAVWPFYVRGLYGHEHTLYERTTRITGAGGLKEQKGFENKSGRGSERKEGKGEVKSQQFATV